MAAMASAMGSAAGSATVAAMGSSCAISLPKGSHARFSSSSAAAGRHQPEQRPLLSCRHVALAERGRGLDSVCQNRQAVNRHSTATWYTHRHVEVGIRHVGRKDTQVDRGSNLKHRHVADCSALSASILPRVITSTIKQDDWLSSVLAGRQSGWLGRASTWQTHVSRSRRTLKTPYSSPVRAKTKVKSTEDHKLTNSAGSRAEEDTLKNDDGPMAEAGSQDTFGTSSVNEPSLAQESQEIKLAAIDQKTPNLVKGSAIAAVALAAVTALANLDVVAQHQDLAMAVVFALGYAGIVFEESLSLNKSAVALVMAVTLWTIRSIAAPSSDIAVVELSEQASSVSEIIFFLLGAMTIVEVVDAHQGFSIVTDAISTRNTRTLLWVIGFLSFFLSSILENLTTTIVMVSLLRKLITNPEQRKYCGAAVVIAANAGGAWTPIGDVTTTMLWIHGQVTTVKIMQALYLPSVACLLVPLAVMSFSSVLAEPQSQGQSKMLGERMAPNGKLVFATGLGALLFVPIFKALTGLPPYLGMLFGLGSLWVLTDGLDYGEKGRENLTVGRALSRIDTQGILFFLGILLSIGCLESAGLLRELAAFLSSNIPSLDLVATLIGLASAVIDNVPLVAATMGMYGLSEFPSDDRLWHLIAYCAGTGGSILIIGSAAGVAYMGMEKTDFFWYLRKVSFPALAGYAAGIAVYILSNQGPVYLENVLGTLPQLPQFPFS